MKTAVDENAIAHSPQTISDFGGQWQIFPDNSGNFVSQSLFEDSLGGLLTLSYFKDKCVGDLGSGTGRIVRWLMEAGARHVYAIEPAKTLDTLKSNTSKFSEQITYINRPGNQLGLVEELDAMISLGVISYIPNLSSTFDATFKALKPGGKFFVLAMSYEGNELYCGVVLPLRRLTVVLPDWSLLFLCRVLCVAASVYTELCKIFPLPMSTYFKSVFGKMAWHDRTMLIFDQLNPTYAKYYTKGELQKIFLDAGFTNLQWNHRYGYSWAVCAEKPVK